MLKFYIILFLFILVSCSARENQVYWCGDHACKNSKERKLYFEKTLVMEVRTIDKSKKSLIDEDKYKKLIEEDKKNKKIIKLEKNKNIKTNDKKNKIAKINTKKSISKIETNNEKIVTKEDTNSQSLERKQVAKKVLKKDHDKNKVNMKKYLDKHDDFDTIVEIIVSNNQNKPYPDINDFPE